MKKSWFLSILIFSLLIINFLTLTRAQESPPGLPSELQQSPEELQNKTTSYLKQEWGKILEKYPLGRFFLKISDILTYLDFFWKPVFGIEYSLSWAFIFSIGLWLILFFIIFPIMTVVLSNKKLPGLFAAFAVSSIIGTTGVIRKAVDLLTFAIKNKWIAWLSLAITIIVMIIIIKLGGGWKKYMAKLKEAEEKRKTEEAQKKIQVAGKVAEKELESFSEGGGI